MPKQVPPSILRALSLPTDPSKSTLSSSGGGSGFSETGSIHAQVPTTADSDGSEEVERKYFLKIASGKEAEEMFRGEYESLNAIAGAVAGFCPRGEAWGSVDGGRYFLATQFLDLGGGRRGGEGALARKLGELHSTPAPEVNAEGDDGAAGEKKRMFGFPVPTFCGDVKQPNRYKESWAEFYAEERLMNVLRESERRNGKDKGLRGLVEDTAGKVVPRLLGDGHLGGAKAVTPVVVHGDLWSGNVGSGKIVGEEGDDGGGKVFDPSACYAHSEFELGIMNMFGGFGGKFFDEYHKIVPKTEPVEEYPDRVRLYELYHHLNHHAIFGGGYRSGAVSIMQKLLKKYS